MSMFGLIVSGRLVQTDFKCVEPGKFAIEVQQANNINHIVIFLTGVEAFPIGLGCQVYINFTGDQSAAWHLLGHLTNEKASAIFKISNLKNVPQPDSIVAAPFANLSTLSSFFGQPNTTAAGALVPQLNNNNHITTATIGISVEPLDVILQSTPAALTNPSQLSNFAEYTQKMLENFYNYVTSFGDANNISMNVVNSWYENFKRRLQADQNFWRK